MGRREVKQGRNGEEGQMWMTEGGGAEKMGMQMN